MQVSKSSNEIAFVGELLSLTPTRQIRPRKRSRPSWFAELRSDDDPIIKVSYVNPSVCFPSEYRPDETKDRRW